MSARMECFFRIVFFVLLSGIHVDGDSYRDRSGYRRYLPKNVVRFDEKKPQRSSNVEWNYRHPEEWGRYYPSCWGSSQSPIDLRPDEMARLEVPSPFQWRGYDGIPRNMTIQNNGHTVQVIGTWDVDETPIISGGVLEGDYVFAQFHYHWGPRDDVGNEHTINNRSLPLELHLVHYKKDYGSFSEALKHEDGVAVVGILFEIGRRRNRAFSEIQIYASSIQTPGPQVNIKPFPLSYLNLNFPGEYVAYFGSLTGPPCAEVVTWILPAIPRSVSRRQINFIRSVQLANGDDHNYRPTMPVNGRMVYYISY